MRFEIIKSKDVNGNTSGYMVYDFPTINYHCKSKEEIKKGKIYTLPMDEKQVKEFLT